MRPTRDLRLLPCLLAAALLAAAAAPAAANHDSQPHPASVAPDAVHCFDSDPGSHDFVTDVGGELALGAFSAPPAPPTVLVVIGHGSTHTIESWDHHMRRLTDDYGVLAVAMEYRGMERVAGSHVDDEGTLEPGADPLPRARNWPQKAGGEDLIAAAQRFQAECPTVQKTILVGVSMGVAMSGYAVSHLPAGAEGLFDVWVACEGVHDMLETYHEAVATLNEAAGWIEAETGGTPAEVPEEYETRTNLLVTDAIESAGLERVVYLHAAYDGLVGYHQSRQMSEQLGIPYEFYTATSRGQGPAGTTLPDHLIDGPEGLLAGHAGEWDFRALLMRATLERIGAVALGEPADCGEYHIEEGATYPDVVFPPVATYDCNSVIANADPTPVDDAGATREGFPITIDVTANDSDPDGDPISTVAATPGQQGVATLEPDGRVTYTPNPGFTGGDSFEYVISDGRSGIASGTVFVPEPGRAALLGAGLGALGLLRLRRRAAGPV